MEDFDITLSLNSENIPVHVHPHVEGEATWYDVMFEDHTISIYKETLYNWTSDNPGGLSQADIHSIGEQIINR